MSSDDILLNEEQIQQLIQKLADDILSQNRTLENMVMIAILMKGFPLAQRLNHIFEQTIGKKLPLGTLDVSLYRDDLMSRDHFVTIRESDIPFDINGKKILLVDDVLYQGRTIRSALNGLVDFGRSEQVEAAVLIDRQAVQLPIFAKYVGIALPVDNDKIIQVNFYEIHGEDVVLLKDKPFRVKE